MHNWGSQTLTVCLVLSGVACKKKSASDSNDTSASIFPFTLTNLVSEATPQGLKSLPSGSTAASSWLHTTQNALFGSSSYSVSSMAAAFDTVLAAVDTYRASLGSDPACLTTEVDSRSILSPDYQAFPVSIQCYLEFDNSSFAFWGLDSTTGTYTIYTRSSDYLALTKFSKNAAGSYDADAFISGNYFAGANTSGYVTHLITSGEGIKIAYAGPDEVCGVNLFADSASISAKGSVSTSSDGSCPGEVSGQFSSIDLTRSGDVDGSKLFSDDLTFRRKAGKKKSGASSVDYQEYANTSGLGNTTIGYVGSPHSDGRDINFGPNIASELGGDRFE